MHKVRKGKQWYFGLKADGGVDAESKVVHSVEATAANVSDSRMLPALLHGNETELWGERAYQGQAEVLAGRAPKPSDRINKRWRAKLKSYPEVRERNRIQSKTRSATANAFSRGACLRLDETQAWLCQDPRPETGQESESARNHLRAHPPMHRAKLPSCAKPQAAPPLEMLRDSSNHRNTTKTPFNPAQLEHTHASIKAMLGAERS
jgi:IS5 family transposase